MADIPDFTPAEGRRAKAEAVSLLRAFDIDDDEFIVKVKPNLRDPGFLGQYRSFSQFRGRPIFWLNSRLHRVVETWLAKHARLDQTIDAHRVAVDTILHEYGHVIWEFARLRDPALYADVREVSDDDEEEFAETFALVVRKGSASPAYRRIIAAYMAALRGKD